MWDSSGNSVKSQNGVYSTDVMSIPIKLNEHAKPILIINPAISYESAAVYMFKRGGTFLGYKTIPRASSSILELDPAAATVSINIKPNLDTDNLSDEEIKKQKVKMWFYVGSLVMPSYKSIKLKYKKETGQEFFRTSIDGTIKLFGDDFDYVNAASIENELLFVVYDARNKALKAINKFSKTDCKFNITKKSVELKLTPIDSYTNIMNKYENTYDLLKIGTPITPLKLSKRFAIQTYILGADSYSCFSANGMYFEDDVNEVIDDADTLANKYHFAKSTDFYEVNIEIDDFPHIMPFACVNNSIEWPSVAYSDEGDDAVYVPYIKLSKVASKGGTASSSIMGWLRYLHSGASGTVISGRYLYDVYSIELRQKTYLEGELAIDVKLYQSFQYYYYVVPGRWFIGENTIIPMSNGSKTFNIEGSINYGLYARLICDVDTFTVDSSTANTYDYPSDDFIIDKANYKKCIGITGSIVKFYQSNKTVKIPTKFGINDYNEYFTSNIDEATTSGNVFNRPMPVSRSAWGNTSVWAIFNQQVIEKFDEALRKEYIIKDAYKVSDVIRALLNKIDCGVMHKNEASYSRFLYSDEAGILDENVSLAGKELFIIPKSNVLKGDYDQAAQKAEITLKQVMSMLANCFKAFWYIDASSNFIIEHIKFFNSGYSYKTNATSQLSYYTDAFNKKNSLYCQTELSYNKSDLQSRFEFGWADDCSELFEGPKIDVISSYVQEDKTETVTAENFSSDIDLMLLAPDKFSSDGFALVVANKNSYNNYETPITSLDDLRDDEYKYLYTSRPQNYYASWAFLENYYMYDMPANNIEYDILLKGALAVKNIYKCMAHDIEFQSTTIPLPRYLYKTEIGDGQVEEMTYNIDTNHVSMSLVYEPK